MSSTKAFTLDIKKLEALERMFKQGLPAVEVGVLKDKNARDDDGTNATIGLIHEMGSENCEQRSFLMMPLSMKFKEYLEKEGLLNKKTLEHEINKRSFEGVAKSIGMIAKKVIRDAFYSGGFGKWPPSDMTHKENHQTLVETQQLRDSIEFRIKEKK